MIPPRIYSTGPKFRKEKQDYSPLVCLALIVSSLALCLVSGQLAYENRRISVENEGLEEELEFYKSYCLPLD